MPHYFEGAYGITGPTANFAWMGLHLWYLLLLFLFSALTLPLLRALRGPRAERVAAAAVVKFVLLVPVAFAIIMGLFHFVVRPVKGLRRLFGIK